MNKRIMAVICIVVATMSFFGGIAYNYEGYKPIIEDIGQSKFLIKFHMPLDTETAYAWLGWAANYHQNFIKAKKFTESKPLEFHQRYWDLYVKIKGLVLEFEEEQKIAEEQRINKGR